MAENLKDLVSKKLQTVTIEKPKKRKDSKGNICDGYCWSNAQHMPTVEMSSKHIKNMPVIPEGKTMLMVVECSLKNLSTRDDDSKDYTLEIDKMGFIE